MVGVGDGEDDVEHLLEGKSEIRRGLWIQLIIYRSQGFRG